MKEIPKYSGCFVCGDKNDIGLKAKFYFDGEKAITEITAETNYEGYRDIFHGGIISTILDEVMIKAILAQDWIAVTAEMTIRFHQPIRSGQKLKCTGWITRHRGRVFLTEGEVADSDGQLLASSTGKYVSADDNLRAQLVKSIDTND